MLIGTHLRSTGTECKPCHIVCKLGAAKLFNETMNCFMLHLLPRRQVSRKPLLQANV